MEAIERYSAEFSPEDINKLVKGSYNNLRNDRNVLDPPELLLSQFTAYNHNDDLYWVRGYDLAKNEDILVPACSVYHPFDLDDNFLRATDTNGLASGNTVEEAVFHGLTELIERDAWSIAKFTRELTDAIVVDDQPDTQFIIDLIQKFQSADIQIAAKDITSDIGVPVIAVFAQDLIYEGMMLLNGFGAHLDPKAALARAILEAAQARVMHIQKFGPGGSRDWVPPYLQSEEEESEYEPWLYAYEQKNLSELEVGYSQDILEDIEAVIAKLQANGLQKIIAVDLTRPEIGIPVVRSIVPGLEVYCFDKTRMGGRLFKSLSEGD
jgi:ribosomal protein S12 methylthiotransferase accessory factor